VGVQPPQAPLALQQVNLIKKLTMFKPVWSSLGDEQTLSTLFLLI
jgi:hypothetical protein